jgi:hypothetical protein
MSRYSPESDVLVTVAGGTEVAGRLTGGRAGVTMGRLAGRAGGLAVTVIFFAPLAGLTAVRGFTAAGLAAAVFGLAAFFATVFFATAFFGAAGFGAAAGLAADIVLAAAVSALDATVMALVAAFIACRAADIVWPTRWPWWLPWSSWSRPR